MCSLNAPCSVAVILTVGWLLSDIIKNVKEHFTFSCKDSDGHTLLHYAAAAGNRVSVIIDLIKELNYDPATPNTMVVFHCILLALKAT